MSAIGTHQNNNAPGVISLISLRDHEEELKLERELARAERDRLLKLLEDEKLKFTNVVRELEGLRGEHALEKEAPAPTKRTTFAKNFDALNHMSITTGAAADMVQKDAIIKTIGLNIHTTPDQLREALFSNHSGFVHQDVLEVVEECLDSTVAWSFFITPTKKCELTLRLQIVGGTSIMNGDEIRIEVFSVESSSLRPGSFRVPRMTSRNGPTSSSMSSKTIRTFRLQLKRGVIYLRPLPFGQTSFTFRAEVSLSEDEDNAINASDLFCKLATLFYERFKQEDEIDERMKQDFIENIPNAPPKTEAEVAILYIAMDLMANLRKNAPRVPGTVNDTVEKYFYRSEDNNTAWGKTRCRIDCSASYLFASLWLLTTYEKKRAHESLAVHHVWEGIDERLGA
ncbi:hypothetical protein TrST_g8532 [Triparma strigata]|uniref:Uncharacterized protein n=1 Tax=Triparma strigata TaxID=1606541 RepID=A0A9W7ES17_9STRA|nr:hypothetical protein TrST_g8532 [Triparma strigata]